MIEVTKQGVPHIHIIAAENGMEERELRKAWYKATGDSYIVDISRRTQMPAWKAICYATKYATKNPWKEARTYASMGMELPIMASEGAMRYLDTKTGAISKFRLKNYRTLYGQVYRYMKDGWLTQDQQGRYELSEELKRGEMIDKIRGRVTIGKVYYRAMLLEGIRKHILPWKMIDVFYAKKGFLPVEHDLDWLKVRLQWGDGEEKRI